MLGQFKITRAKIGQRGLQNWCPCEKMRKLCVAKINEMQQVDKLICKGFLLPELGIASFADFKQDRESKYRQWLLLLLLLNFSL